MARLLPSRQLGQQLVKLRKRLVRRVGGAALSVERPLGGERRPYGSAPSGSGVSSAMLSLSARARDAVPGTQKAPPERGPDLLFRWWRGQDLNLRPSGYETDGWHRSPYQGVPCSNAELGFRAAARTDRTVSYRPVTPKSVEEV